MQPPNTLSQCASSSAPVLPLEPVPGVPETVVRSIFELWGSSRNKRFDFGLQPEQQAAQGSSASSSMGSSVHGAGTSTGVKRPYSSLHSASAPSSTSDSDTLKAAKTSSSSSAAQGSTPLDDSDPELVECPPPLIKKGSPRPPWAHASRTQPQWLFDDLPSGLARLAAGKLQPEAVVEIPSPEENGWEGMTLLMVLALEGGPDAVGHALAVLKAGGNVNARNETDGITPLHYAAQRGCVELVRFFLGRDGFIYDSDGSTQLSHAANVHVRDDDGWTALHYCTLKLDGERRGSDKDLAQCMKLLLGAGANMRSRTREREARIGKTALHLASEERLRRCVEVLLAQDASTVHDKDALGNTALLYAAFEGDTETVKLLLQYGSDVSWHGENGWTALHNSAASDAIAAADKLLKEGADVNARDAEGATPLHVACSNLAHGMVKKLCDAGADVNAADEAGRVPLHELAAQVIAPNSDNYKTDSMASQHALKWLICAGADLDAADPKGRTGLHFAASVGNVDHIKTMTSRHGKGTPLGAFSEDGGAATRAKASKAADADKADVSGWTALHYAAAAGHKHCISILLARGAVERHKAHNGKTPKDVALEYFKGEEAAELAALFDKKNPGL